MTKMYQAFVSLDQNYLKRGFLAIGSSQITNLGIALVTAYFFANYIDKGVFGSYQFVLTTLGIMTIFTLRGVGKQVVRQYVQSGEEVLFSKTIQFIVYSIPVASIGILFAGYFYIKDNPTLALALLLIAIAFPFFSSLLLYNSLLLAKEKFVKQAVLTSIQVALPSTCLIISLIQGTNLVGLILVYCLSNVGTLFGLYLYTVISENVNINYSFKPSSAELHLSLSQSILDLGKIADRLIVFSLLGVTIFASYMIALLPIRELLRIPQIIRALVLPRFSQYTYSQVQKTVLIKTVLLFAILSVIAILYISLAPIIFRLVFPLYTESIYTTQLIALVLPFSSSIIMNQLLTVFDKTKALYLVNISFTLVTVVLLFILGYRFGLIGIVYAKLLATACRFIALTCVTIYLK